MIHIFPVRAQLRLNTKCSRMFGYLSSVPNEVEYFAVARRFFEMLEAEQAKRDEREGAKEEKSEKTKEKDALGVFNLQGKFLGMKLTEAAE